MDLALDDDSYDAKGDTVTLRRMAESPPLFAKPNHALTPLRVRPRLASWMSADHPDQIRLEAFLAHAQELVLPQLVQLDDPLALCLEIGLPPSTPLLDQHDLDNYLFPLACRLSKQSGRQFMSVWGSKRHAETSYIGVAEARAAAERPPPDHLLRVRTNVSSQSTAYKEQIHEQLADVDALPEGPVSLQLSFSVGPRRNWLNLWKATIDALDPLLGPTSPDHRWHPRDGRIVELGLHCRVEPLLGNQVAIAIDAAVR